MTREDAKIEVAKLRRIAAGFADVALRARECAAQLQRQADELQDQAYTLAKEHGL